MSGFRRKCHTKRKLPFSFLGNTRQTRVLTLQLLLWHTENTLGRSVHTQMSIHCSLRLIEIKKKSGPMYITFLPSFKNLRYKVEFRFFF